MPDVSEVSEAGGQVLPEEVQAAIEAAQQQETEAPEVPSVMSTTTRYIVGQIGVSHPAPDGSRVLRLISGNAATIIEANLSPELCAAAVEGLTAVEVIPQDDEEKEAPADAGDGEN